MTEPKLLITDDDPEIKQQRMHATLMHLLHTVFGATWVGQHRFTATDEIDALHAELGAGPDSHVLDIGSGMGGPAIYLAQQTGCRVTGIDAAAENVQLAQTAAAEVGVAEQVAFVLADAASASFPAGAFDAIVSHDAFATIPDKARMLAQGWRWLRPAGRLAATLIVMLGEPLQAPESAGRLAWPIPTAGDYRLLVEAAGFDILKLDDLTPAFREIGARWRGALMVWELALISGFADEEWRALRATFGQLAEWATQGRVGHIRLIAQRSPHTP